MARTTWDSNGTVGDVEVKKLMDEWQQWVNDEAKSRGIYDSYLYLNYMGTMDVSPYNNLPKDTFGRLLEVQATYDPKSVFADLWKGGFKLSSNV